MCRGLYDDQTPEEQLARLTREEKTTGVEPRADIDAVSVTTVAGRNFYGADARVSALGDRDPNGEIGLCISSICHAPGRGDSLLIADDRRYQTIHAVYPAATEKRALNRVLTTVLIKTDALPVLPVISVITDYVTETRVVLIGGSERGFSNGKCLTETKFQILSSLCIDPLIPSNFYAGDHSSIRYCDAAADTFSLVVGGEKFGYANGIGAAASFSGAWGMVCTSNGERLYFTDRGNNWLRVVEIKTRELKTVAGDGDTSSRDGIGMKASIYYPGKLVWDRTRTLSKPESALWFTLRVGIGRYDLTSGEVKIIYIEHDIDTAGIASLSNGCVLFSCEVSHAVYSYYPPTAELKLLAGRGVVSQVPTPGVDGSGRVARFLHPTDLIVIESERCSYIADYGNGRLRHLALPDSVFADRS